MNYGEGRTNGEVRPAEATTFILERNEPNSLAS
jgi:hypothetical protein